MNAIAVRLRAARLRRWRYWSRLPRPLLLALGLLLTLSLPGELAHATLQAPAALTVTMSNPVCVEILPASGDCSIEMSSLTASSSAQDFGRLELLVNGKLRLSEYGFFESSAYLSPSMLPGGLKVTCGRANDGGLPDYGRSYSITANAYLTDGSSSSDAATVYCPAFDGSVYLPLIAR
jgi:hypothetical protein